MAVTADIRRALRWMLATTCAGAVAALVWNACAIPMYEAQARFQIPREVWDLLAANTNPASSQPYQKLIPPGDAPGLSPVSGPELVLSAQLWQAALRHLEAAATARDTASSDTDLLAREAFWQDADPGKALSQQCRLELDERAGLDEVTIRYTTSESQAAVPVVQAVLETILESCPAPHTGRMGLDPAREAEKVRHKAALDRQRLACDELRVRQNALAAERSRREISLEQAKSLASTVADCRRQRLIAENRLIQVKRDLERGLSLELIATRLPAAESQRLLQELATHEKLRAETLQVQSDIERLSTIYGRNHPQMRELREKQADLQARLRMAGGPQGELEMVSGEQPAIPDRAEFSRWILHLLDSERHDLLATERDLQAQLDAETSALDALAEQQRELQQAEQELARLEAVSDELARPAQSASPAPRLSLPVISPPALLAGDPAGGLGTRLWWCMSAGLVVGLVIEAVRRIRARSPARTPRSPLQGWHVPQPAILG